MISHFCTTLHYTRQDRLEPTNLPVLRYTMIRDRSIKEATHNHDNTPIFRIWFVIYYTLFLFNWARKGWKQYLSFPLSIFILGRWSLVIYLLNNYLLNNTICWKPPVEYLNYCQWLLSSMATIRTTMTEVVIQWAFPFKLSSMAVKEYRYV